MRKLSKKILVSVFIFSVVLFGLSNFTFYNGYASLRQQEESALQNINDMEWVLIETLLQENTYLAKNKLDIMKANIEKEIKVVYGEKSSKLKYDIENIENKSYISDLLFKYVEDSTFKTLRSNSSSIFIITPSYVIANNDEDQGFIKVLNEEVQISKDIVYNDLSFQSALFDIKNKQTEKDIFWEPRENTFVPDHKMLGKITKNELRQIFLTEGLAGLREYESLVPIYITRSGDVLGVHDYTVLGERINNNKIIIVQKFKLHSIISLQYNDKINMFEKSKDKIRDTSKERFTDLVILQVMSLFVFLLLWYNIFKWWREISRARRFKIEEKEKVL